MLACLIAKKKLFRNFGSPKRPILGFRRNRRASIAAKWMERERGRGGMCAVEFLGGIAGDSVPTVASI